MTASFSASDKLLAATFLTAARRYWISVFPRVCHEIHHWRHRAEAIPDPVLRRLALEAQRIKRGNVEGSAAFASFAPATHRGEAVRAQVAFQSAYDYVDTIGEQPNPQPVANGRQLHQALLTALDQNTGHPDYYACGTRNNDACYLEQIIDACRSALAALPSHATVREPANRLAERIVLYQSLNLSEPHGGHRLLERWAQNATPPATGLRWWETAASAGSSLGVFALISAAAQPSLKPREAVAIEEAYWPWIGALHSLLDGLIDEPEDTAVAQRSLLSYYDSPQEAASRLQTLARGALHAISPLPDAHEHAVLLSGMASYYLTTPEASSPAAQLISRRLIDTLGPMTRASMVILSTRRTAERIHARRSPRGTPIVRVGEAQIAPQSLRWRPRARP
jgi:tetraprenyl-beta-curcumene synthase